MRTARNGVTGMNIQVIHGPNLNLLGTREPEVYGSQTLEQINDAIRSAAKDLHIKVRFFQSNSEGELISAVHEAAGWADALLINPGAYTHTSIGLRDAIVGCSIPTIEVHLSNVYAREEFRHHSYISPIAIGVISGFGSRGYLMALHAASEMGFKKK